jgi:hypothetical protein
MPNPFAERAGYRSGAFFRIIFSIALLARLSSINNLISPNSFLVAVGAMETIL